MICPHCGGNFLMSEAIKRNVKGFENVDVSYDVVCPHCRRKTGRMFWGKLFVDSRPANYAAVVGRRAEGGRARTLRYCCPHCGGVLPEDLSRLPEHHERRRYERRKTERRSGQMPYPGPERRQNERRQDAERRRLEIALVEEGYDLRKRNDRRKAQQAVLFERRSGQERRRPGSAVQRKV